MEFPGASTSTSSKALGEVLGWNVSIDLVQWELAQERVLAGKADLVTAMGITKTRRGLWDFATPTFTHAYQLFVTAGEASIRGEADLAGKRVGVTAGGVPREYFEKRPDVRIVRIANYEEGFALLRKGAIDAVAADAWVAGYVINRKRIEGIASAGAAVRKTRRGDRRAQGKRRAAAGGEPRLEAPRRARDDRGDPRQMGAEAGRVPAERGRPDDHACSRPGRRRWWYSRAWRRGY